MVHQNLVNYFSKKSEYLGEKRGDFYDGLEEILPNSDSEDDERIFTDQNRVSFTREQLVEYQQLIKLLRFIKVSIHSFFSSDNKKCLIE